MKFSSALLTHSDIYTRFDIILRTRKNNNDETKNKEKEMRTKWMGSDGGKIWRKKRRFDSNLRTVNNIWISWVWRHLSQCTLLCLKAHNIVCYMLLYTFASMEFVTHAVHIEFRPHFSSSFLLPRFSHFCGLPHTHMHAPIYVYSWCKHNWRTVLSKSIHIFILCCFCFVVWVCTATMNIHMKLNKKFPTEIHA